jgi:copper(I)-binding protein
VAPARHVAESAEQEAPVNPFERRTSAHGRSLPAALAACGFVVAVALTGCSSGQVSQTATQEPAINGTSGYAGEITLRNIHLRADQTSDYIQPGRDVALILTAANNSPDIDDKLLSITSDVGSVTVTGDTALPATDVLVIGTPDGQPTPLENIEVADSAEATVELTKPITNGLTYDFTFTFEKAGETTVNVPVSAGESPRRDGPVKAGDSADHSGGGH